MVYHSNSAMDGLDITNYWQYFNLNCDPFAMNADEALIYVPAYWEEMLDLIQYITHYKNQLVVVTGSNGIGKTVLADLLETQLGESVHCVKIAAEQNTSVMRLLEFLSDAFLVPWQPEENIEKLLDDQLQAFQHKGKNCLLLIDNAQLLPTETLEALLYFVSQQSESQMRFHIALFGESTLRQTLQRMLEPAEEALVHFLTVEPLSLEESAQYLDYRLSAANWQGASPMAEEVVARIYRLSEGNPARINRIARRFLLDLLTEQDEGKKSSWFGKHTAQLVGAGLVVIILLILAVWIWRSDMMQHVTLAKVETVKPTVTVNGAVLPEAQIKYVDQAALSEVKTKTTEQDQVPTAAGPAAPVADEHNHKVDVVVMPPAPAPAPAPAPIQAPALPKSATTSASMTEEKATQPAKVAETQATAAPQAATVQSPAPAAIESAHAATVPTADAVPAAASTETAPVQKKAASAKKVPAAQTEKNSTQGPYTIQLLHLQHDGSLAQFIKQNHLEGKVQLVTRQAHGKKVTEVIYGSYKTMHDAEQAVATLPDSLMSAAPWPKKKEG